MTSNQVRTTSLFATPVLSEMWSDAAANTTPLLSAILNRQKMSRGVQMSNVLGWQSDPAMQTWGGEAASRLLSHITASCDAMTQDVGTATNGSDRERRRWVTSMWANLAHAGASNQTHSHPGALWSAIYYVDDGYAGSANRALGGELVFLDPRMPMVRARTPDLRWRKPNGQYDSQECWVRPKAGLIVLFPSWLMHGVRPYHGNGTRVSIAMNLSPRFEDRQVGIKH